MPFTSILPPRDRPPKTRGHALQRLILNHLSLSSWLLIGGLFQSLILALTPSAYAHIPMLAIFAILGVRLIKAVFITYGLIKNPSLEGAILYKHAVQIPNADGEFSDVPASERVVCLHLGAKFHHPAGIFAADSWEMGNHLSKMICELDDNMDSNGFLGGSQWQSYDQRGALETNFIAYWRSLEDVHRFAHGETHRKAWDWFNSLAKEQSALLGINHELFSSEPGQWEAIYSNFQPTLLGATTYLKKGDKLIGGTVEDKWISPLVDARRGKLRTSAGRLGWQPDLLEEKYGQH
ncbi:hypothetical protein B0J12DRAFT_109784 [Macrophomina phaseolina]|uniref:Dimeric alpha-beta barrel n=1 Tax=Macrophomina phaseolina TaxID=35725 RepID=A0ABQ8GAZ8_9PEZI|nr:hypothetical protein B0J12DRAFT_109784 [Macrophomina phaseolina]